MISYDGVSTGDQVSVGANSWLPDEIPDHTCVFITDSPEHERKRTDCNSACLTVVLSSIQYMSIAGRGGR